MFSVKLKIGELKLNLTVLMNLLKLRILWNYRIYNIIIIGVDQHFWNCIQKFKER